MEVDIYNFTGRQTAVTRRSRARRYAESSPKQRNLNDKKAKRYFGQLLKANFKSGDYHITCTYNRENLPVDVEGAEKEARKYIRRISEYAKKNGLDKPKYILVTSAANGKTGEAVRVHHHIVLSCQGLTREAVEELWRKPRGKGEKCGKRLGHCNCDVIDGGEGLNPLAQYLCKQGSAKKRWSASVGLVKPYYKLNDDKYSRTEVGRFVKERMGDKAFWERKYPGWKIDGVDYGIKCEYSDVSGWAVYLRFRRD